MSKEMEIKQECCNIWNNLKDKTEMIDCLIESKKRVADLEAKLAEMTEKYNACQEARKLEIEFSQQDKKELKQQLAEKDKAIENWQTMYQSVMKSCHNGIEEDKRLREQLAEKEKEIQRTHNYYQAVRNRETIRESKIEFAVNRLEKVKEKTLHFYVNDTPKLTGFYIDVNEIDNQIKQLKEMK